MASFYFLTNLVQKYTLADCCTVCFSEKKENCWPVCKGCGDGEGGGTERLLAGKRTAGFIV